MITFQDTCQLEEAHQEDTTIDLTMGPQEEPTATCQMELTEEQILICHQEVEIDQGPLRDLQEDFSLLRFAKII